MLIHDFKGLIAPTVQASSLSVASVCHSPLEHPALSDLQCFAQLNSTRQWHGQSISFLGLGLSSIGGNLVAAAVVTTLIILYCKCCRNQGGVGSAASPGTTNIIQAAGPILPAPVQYPPVAVPTASAPPHATSQHSAILPASCVFLA